MGIFHPVYLRFLTAVGMITEPSRRLMGSWFWLIGAIIPSIPPTTVTEVLGGSEIIVKSYLAIFAVTLGALSGWMAFSVNQDSP